MKIILTIFLSFACTLFTYSQKTILDAFVEAPDSIFPLFTTNNKLDIRDFLNAGREPMVRNKFDQLVEINAYNIPGRYFGLITSDRSVVNMKLLLEQNGEETDTTICMCSTYKGPAYDSDISFYDLHWNKLDRKAPKPSLEEFYLPGMPEDTKQEFEMLPLIKANLLIESDSVRWELQTTELSHDAKKTASKYLQPIIKPLR